MTRHRDDCVRSRRSEIPYTTETCHGSRISAYGFQTHNVNTKKNTDPMWCPDVIDKRWSKTSSSVRAASGIWHLHKHTHTTNELHKRIVNKLLLLLLYASRCRMTPANRLQSRLYCTDVLDLRQIWSRGRRRLCVTLSDDAAVTHFIQAKLHFFDACHIGIGNKVFCVVYRDCLHNSCTLGLRRWGNEDRLGKRMLL